MSNYTTSLLLRFWLLAILALAGTALPAQNKTWTNGNNTGLWGDANNWSPAGAPTATSRVIFNNTSSANCTLNTAATIARLTIEAGYTGNLNLGSQTLTVGGNVIVANAASFTSGAGSKVVISSASRLDCPAPFYALEINTALADDRVRMSQLLNVTQNLTITQVGNLAGSDIRVGGNILINDPDLANRAIISATGNGTLSGTQLRRLNVEATANLQLPSDFPLNNNFRLTGSGSISGAGKLILGSNGTLDFSGTVQKVRINTAVSTQSITLSQHLNIANDLEIAQVGSLNGVARELRVNGNIIATDNAIGGSAILSLVGSGTNSFQGTGGGNYRQLYIAKSTAASRALLNSSDNFLLIAINNGVLDLNGKSPGGPIDVNAGGTLGGVGTVNGNVLCSAGGSVSPGNSPGILSINGNLTVNGTLIMEIAGRGDNMGGGPGVAGTDFDQIVVSGSAIISNLSVLFTGTIITTPPTFPAGGDTYTLISGSASIGSSIITPININGAFSGGILMIGNTAFPVELLYFSGSVKGQAIHLAWATATERNNDYMAVERSADGSRFTEIGRVKGAGNILERQEYVFVDEKPLPGMNYYRLRQVDFDGAFEYHKPVGLLFESKGPGLGFEVFPNPAQEQLQARWISLPGQPATLFLTDTSGRLMAKRSIPAGVGAYELPLEGLPSGLYFLQLRQGEQVEVVRFHKE